MSRLSTLLVAGLLSAGLVATSIPRAQAATDADAARLQARLAALQADPALGRLAAYEQMEARTAIAALAQARRNERPDALFLAERRVEIAETLARAEAARRELNQLDLQRGELLLEASRRETERVRKESERLRIQSQIQAEETERLRMAAEAEVAARAEVEQALGKATGRQTAQLSAARRKEAELARQEAELVSGKKLPASRFEGQGEVFTLPGAAYASGKGSLSGSGKDAAEALSAYLQIGKRSVRVEAWDSDAKVAQARAAALRDALVAGGVPASRVKAEGKKGAATSQRSAVVSIAP